MGNCVGGGQIQENVFKVININDNRSVVQRGLMEVTPTELVYVDSKTKEDWHWPLKFLRKYGCDGDVFTFEAGRKCPGGEGLYAFSTRKASALFEIVARNINQGNLQPGGELSPFSEPQAPDSNILSFPARRTSTTATPTNPQDQPSYTNIDMMIENGNHVGPPSPTATSTPDPNKVQYREVIFDRPPDEHPKPSGEPTKPPTSYTQIDFDQTARLSEQARVRGGVRSGSVNAPHGRTSSTSTSGNISPTKRGRRQRVHTYTSGGRNRHFSRSESSFSSQSSLTESSRDVSSPPKANGGVPRASISDPNSTYQNLTIPEQQQYQNVHVGAGDVGQVFDTASAQIPQQQQPNYCNVSVASGGGASPVPVDTGRSQIRVNGDPMTTYAQLELSSERRAHSHSKKKQRSMSSSAASRDTALQSSYLQLEFQKGGGAEGGSTVPQPSEAADRHHSKRSASVGTAASSRPPAAVSMPSTEQDIREEEPSSAAAAEAAAETVAGQQPKEVVDDTKVIYHALNFAKMDALTQLAQQREEEREQEREEREQKERERDRAKKKK